MLRKNKTLALTAAQLTALNPILGYNQFARETDTNKMKIGNGLQAYNDLTYIAGDGGGASAVFENDLTASGIGTVGGAVDGDFFAAGSPHEAAIRKILTKYQVPFYTSFGIQGQSAALEIGQAITAGPKTFQWAATNGANIQSVTIRDVNNAIDLLTTDNTDQTEVYNLAADIVKLGHNNLQTYQIKGVNTQGNNMVSRNYNIQWYAPTYFMSIDNGDDANPPAIGTIPTNLAANPNKVILSNGKFQNKILNTTGWIVVLFDAAIPANGYSFKFNARYNGSFAQNDTIVGSAQMHYLGSIVADLQYKNGHTLHAYAFPQRYIIDASITEFRIGVV